MNDREKLTKIFEAAGLLVEEHIDSIRCNNVLYSFDDDNNLKDILAIQF